MKGHRLRMDDWLHRKANQVRLNVLWLLLTADEKAIAGRAVLTAYATARRVWQHSQALPIIIGGILNAAEQH